MGLENDTHPSGCQSPERDPQDGDSLADDRQEQEYPCDERRLGEDLWEQATCQEIYLKEASQEQTSSVLQTSGPVDGPVERPVEKTPNDGSFSPSFPNNDVPSPYPYREPTISSPPALGPIVVSPRAVNAFPVTGTVSPAAGPETQVAASIPMAISDKLSPASLDTTLYEKQTGKFHCSGRRGPVFHV